MDDGEAALPGKRRRAVHPIYFLTEQHKEQLNALQRKEIEKHKRERQASVLAAALDRASAKKLQISAKALAASAAKAFLDDRCNNRTQQELCNRAEASMLSCWYACNANDCKLALQQAHAASNSLGGTLDACGMKPMRALCLCVNQSLRDIFHVQQHRQDLPQLWMLLHLEAAASHSRSTSRFATAANDRRQKLTHSLSSWNACEQLNRFFVSVAEIYRHFSLLSDACSFDCSMQLMMLNPQPLANVYCQDFSRKLLGQCLRHTVEMLKLVPATATAVLKHEAAAALSLAAAQLNESLGRLVARTGIEAATQRADNEHEKAQRSLLEPEERSAHAVLALEEERRTH
jgi:hypothetical protein